MTVLPHKCLLEAITSDAFITELEDEHRYSCHILTEILRENYGTHHEVLDLYGYYFIQFIKETEELEDVILLAIESDIYHGNAFIHSTMAHIHMKYSPDSRGDAYWITDSEYQPYRKQFITWLTHTLIKEFEDE